ncbi:uncharacterized protein LOC124936051 [Impatiens glandulifera]|uniref:uncharacterized protein LOC124936051 n=1 Tax=Impatiens glandulifera TaxID=253017 RepID=UPI001FB09C7C|nr:uncharacterized protein LOC124936051 [Impatiens glandulifera]
MTMQQDHQSKIFYDLSNLILNLLRYPPTTISLSDHRQIVRRPPPTLPPISPAGFASMMLGMSLALMLCGSITFFIGFLLMPWVIGLIMFLYLVGVVSTFSMLGRAIFCHTITDPPSSSTKDVPAWKLL